MTEFVFLKKVHALSNKHEIKNKTGLKLKNVITKMAGCTWDYIMFSTNLCRK